MQMALEKLAEQLYDVALEGRLIGNPVMDGVGDAIFMNPATWLANSSMTLSKYLPWERHSFDSMIKGVAKRLGKEITKPVFGSHKTVEGAAIGVGIGSLAGYLSTVLPFLSAYFKPEYAVYASAASALVVAGDMVGSFIKRRLGRKEGTDLPLLDSLAWMAGYPLLYQWMNGSYSDVPRAVASLAITYGFGYAFHRASNYLGEKIGVTNTVRE